MSGDQHDLVWREIDRIETCMMVTYDGENMRSRPMAGTADRPGNTIWFVTNRSAHKDDELARDSRVNLAYADVSKNTYVSISGHARLSDDRAKLRELWTTAIDAWFKGGPEDPAALLIAVTPQSAEVWNNPSSDIVVALKMLTASATHSEPPKIGETVKVEM